MENELLSVARTEALQALKFFCEKLSLPASLLEDVCNVEIKVDENIYGDPLIYKPMTNSVHVDRNYLASILMILKKNDIDKTNIIYNLSKSIVHELFHAHRIKLIGFTANDDFVEVNKLYFELLKAGYIDDSRKYAPVRISKNSFDTFDLIVYNADEDYYELFSNLTFNDIDSLNDKDLFSFVSDKINSPNFLGHPDRIIIDGNDESEIEGFEEIMSEVVADIVIRAYVMKELDLDLITSKIMNDNSYEIDYNIGAKLINKVGKKLLVWFINASSIEELKHIVGSEYQDLIHCLNELYQALYHSEIPKQQYIDESIDIINGIDPRR